MGLMMLFDLDDDNDGILDINENCITSYKSINRSGQWVGRTDSQITITHNSTPVDTDEDNVTDMLDTDSDNDGVSDCLENNSAIEVCPITTAIVGNNGLASWAENNDSYIDTNGLAYDGTNFTLDDSDNDTAANGSDASATTKDLDYRDNSIPKAIDANHTIDTAGKQVLDLESLITDSAFKINNHTKGKK